MKHKVIALLCLPLLFSCQSTPIESNSSFASSSIGENSSNSSSSFSSSWEPDIENLQEITPKDAYSLLKKLARVDSYKVLSCLFSDDAYTDYLTPNYYYNTGLGYGYIQKESFDKSYGQSIVYTFTLEGEEVKLGGPRYSYNGGSLQYVNDLSILFAFKDYENYVDKIDADSFKAAPSGLAYSENKYVIRLFSASIGITDDESLKQIARIRFFSMDGKMGFVLQGKQNGSYFNHDSTWTLYEDIGDVSYPLLDQYLANHYALGKEMPNENTLSLLHLSSSKPLKLHNELHVYIDGKDEGVNRASELLLTPSKAERFTIDPTDESKTSDILNKHEDGYAYEVGYNEKGEVEEKLYEKYLDWNDIVPDLEAKVLEEKECYRLEGGVYNYYGRLTNRLKDFFGQLQDFNRTPDRMWLTTNSKGLIDGAIFEFPFTKYVGEKEEDSFVYRFVLECKVVEDNSKISELSPLSDDLKIKELETAFSYFDGSKPYQVTFRDTLSDYDGETITYADSVYYDETKSLLFSGDYRITGSGYYKKGNGIQSFIRTKEGNFFARAPLKEGDLKEVSPHSLNSALFVKKGDAYVFRDHVLSYVSKGLPLSYNASLMFPETASFKVTDSKLSSISYTYDWDVVNSRSEVATFQYENVSLPAGLKETLSSLEDFVKPTSWKDEGNEIYENFVSLYGDEAKNIPYLYMEGTYKQWESDYSISDQIELLNKTTAGIDTSYYEEYRSLLLQNGFVKAESPSLPGAEEYNLGKIKVRLAKVLRGGFYFTLNS